MALTAEALKEEEEILEWVLRRVRHHNSGELRAIRTLERYLVKAFPRDGLFHFIEALGRHLAARADALALYTGRHAAVQDLLRPLNKGSAAWLTAFMGPAQGRRITAEVLAEIEASAASFIYESHHAVEVRVAEYFPEIKQTYGVLPDGKVDAAAMRTVALPADAHRGVRYYPLEKSSKKLRALRGALPGGTKSLTADLISTFPDAYFKKGASLQTFMADLSVFYRDKYPSLYREVTLPNPLKGQGGPASVVGGLRRSLQDIAQDLGIEPEIVVKAN